MIPVTSLISFASHATSGRSGLVWDRVGRIRPGQGRCQFLVVHRQVRGHRATRLNEAHLHCRYLLLLLIADEATEFLTTMGGHKGWAGDHTWRRRLRTWGRSRKTVAMEVLCQAGRVTYSRIAVCNHARHMWSWLLSRVVGDGHRSIRAWQQSSRRRAGRVRHSPPLEMCSRSLWVVNHGLSWAIDRRLRSAKGRIIRAHLWTCWNGSRG